MQLLFHPIVEVVVLIIHAMPYGCMQFTIYFLSYNYVFATDNILFVKFDLPCVFHNSYCVNCTQLVNNLCCRMLC